MSRDDSPDRVALVTGAASGIGWGIATRLVKDGYMVVAFDRDDQGLTSLAERLGGHGRYRGFGVDIARRDEVDAAVAQATGELGPIAVAVNNAGIVQRSDLLSTSPDDWDRLMAVNLTGVYNICRSVLPGMLDARDGVIVNISSVVAAVGYPDRAAYAATKAGVVGLTKAMAVDYADHNVRVNAICPGTVATPILESILARAEDPDAARRDLDARQPLGRMGRPEDIAHAVAFLASEEAAFITGTTLPVDGGWSATLTVGSPPDE